MKKLLSVVCFTWLFIDLQAQVYPTAEYIAYTFMISQEQRMATSFAIKYKGKKYLVTARHLFDSKIKSGDQILAPFYFYNRESKIESKIFFHENPEIDLAVLNFSDSLPGLSFAEISKTYDQPTLGQELIFLGFPLGFSSKAVGNGLLPLLKKASLAGVLSLSKSTMFLLDGHNNSGFSGGPVLVKDPDTNKLSLLGVVTSYINEPKRIGAVGSEFIFNENSGIIVCVPSNYIRELIDQIKK